MDAEILTDRDVATLTGLLVGPKLQLVAARDRTFRRVAPDTWVELDVGPAMERARG